MKILVVGSGGREHALVWKIAQSPKVEKIYCAPGNAGTAQLAENISIAAEDIFSLLKFAKENKIDLTVVGPEAPLVAGIVNEFQKEGLAIFGPTKEAARIEGSKVFAKDLMVKYGIPTPHAMIFRDADEAVNYINEQDKLHSISERRMVVKADGLAAGKGVIVCSSKEEAIDAVNLIMRKKEFGEAGREIVIEECLKGEEVSILAFTDSETIIPMASAQDHKRVFDQDSGPNTGGMGAYSPAPMVDDKMMERIHKEILKPIILAMKTEGFPYDGVLYAGLMITSEGLKVLEFNCRFGDPETQPILMRLKSDLVEVMLATVHCQLSTVHLQWEERPAVCVVLASGGYPGAYKKGYPISGLDEVSKLKDVVVFHAGTKFDPRPTTYDLRPRVITNGGRVLGVTALGDSIKEAINNCYSAVKLISFQDMHYRRDIGQKALKWKS